MINVLGHKFSECQHRYKMAYRSIQLKQPNNEFVVTKWSKKKKYEKSENVETYLNFGIEVANEHINEHAKRKHGNKTEFWFVSIFILYRGLLFLVSAALISAQIIRKYKFEFILQVEMKNKHKRIDWRRLELVFGFFLLFCRWKPQQAMKDGLNFEKHQHKLYLSWNSFSSSILSFAIPKIWKTVDLIGFFQRSFCILSFLMNEPDYRHAFVHSIYDCKWWGACPKELIQL